jgi:TolB-like protein
MWKQWISLIIVAALSGCATFHSRSHTEKNLDAAKVRIFMPPFYNATDDEHAGRALTELTASALLRRDVPLVQTEASLAKSRIENAGGPEGLYLDVARSLQATHLLIGTVHEYHYKTDLDGNPAVGITLRLVDAQDGRTVWQRSSARVGLMFASLSTTAARAVRDLVADLPLQGLRVP